jgi:NAD(P)-dependent dehydrogenase (short-subunit alcohol dehydrogenase family)
MKEVVMELGLKGKAVGITGGTSGIGRACALRYLAEGCRVAVCGRDRGKLQAFERQCRDAGHTEILCRQADVADPEALENFIDSTANAFGRIDIWYNNAGFGVRKPLLDVSAEEWDGLMNVNLRAVFTASKMIARHMIDRGGGVIANASSFTARIPVAGNGPYSVSKWAVTALTRVLAAELAPRNIRVFAYIPGMIVTELTKERVERQREYLSGQCALNRLGNPEDLAPILVMLTSDLAGYFTGETIDITGGKFCVQNPAFAWDNPQNGTAK